MGKGPAVSQGRIWIEERFPQWLEEAPLSTHYSLEQVSQ